MKTLMLFILIFCIFESCRKEPHQHYSCIELQGQTDKYIFPIRPGMDEWKKLDSHQAMVNVCQIPKSTLSEICTIGLVDTYYDYPLLFTAFAFTSINQGLDQVALQFNGFGELIDRGDCATKLLLRYEQISPAQLDRSLSLIEQGLFMQKIQFMEVTLSYPPVTKKLTSSERKKVIQMGLQKHKEKKENGYSGPSAITNIYLIGNVLKTVGYKPFLDFLSLRGDLDLFLCGSLNDLQYVDDGNTIVNYAESFLINN